MRVTGSKVHRVWKCPASAVLPQLDVSDARWEPARAKGKGVHRFLERAKADRPQALAEIEDKDVLALCSALDLDDLPVGLACEVAFAWNWKARTARELGRRDALPRTADGAVDYDALGVDWSCEVPCTLDVVGVQYTRAQEDTSEWADKPPHSKGYVGDYKSGHSKYPAPDMFGQTLLGACCVRSVYGCDDVVVELIHIHDNGGHHKARRTVTDWDLDAFERELAEAMAHIDAERYWMPEMGTKSAREAVVEGPWCDFCPAYRACPAKVALVRAIPEKLIALGVRPGTLPDKDGVEQPALVLTPGMLTVRNAADAWMALEAIEAVINRAKQEICGIGAFEEIPLPDGRVIGRLVTERRGINGKIGAEVIEKRYGREERDKRVEISVTMSALRQAVVANIKPGEKIEKKDGTGVYDRMLQEIDQLGGIEISTTDSVKPHVPKKKRLTSG